jgi:hypothetical protein
MGFLLLMLGQRYEDYWNEVRFFISLRRINNAKMAIELKPNPGDKILCLKVGKIARENLYEMTRKYWKVGLNRAKKATHVLAVVNGIVEAVFIPQTWMYTDNPDHEGRCEFTGTEDVSSDYIGKDVRGFYKQGSSNPVRYINM